MVVCNVSLEMEVLFILAINQNTPYGALCEQKQKKKKENETHIHQMSAFWNSHKNARALPSITQMHNTSKLDPLITKYYSHLSHRSNFICKIQFRGLHNFGGIIYLQSIFYHWCVFINIKRFINLLLFKINVIFTSLP